MDFNINIYAGTFSVDGKTYELKSAGITNPSKMAESEILAILEGIDLSALTPLNEDTFEKSSSSINMSDKSADELKAIKADLEAKRSENYDEMDDIQSKVENLVKKAEELIDQATAKVEGDVEEKKQQAKDAVNQQVQAYIEANKNGEGMSQDDLRSNINGALDAIGLPQIAPLFNALAKASGILDEVDSLLGDLRTLIDETNSIELELSTLDNGIKLAEAVEAEKTAANNSCDPIGFEFDGANYDFIVGDEDGFNSTSDFLGADDQWAAMQALDTNNDGIVDMDEFNAANIKLVKTEGDSQSVVDIADVFGDDFSVDLNSYNSAFADENPASYAGISTGDHDGDGIADQTLLGTFNLNINGESVQGYNTLDDTEWLIQKYGISSPFSTFNPETNEFEYSDSLKAYDNFVEIYEEKVQQLRDEIAEQQGISKESIADFQETLDKESETSIPNFFSSLDINQGIEEDDENQDELLDDEVLAA